MATSVLEYQSTIADSGNNKYQNRVFIGTAVTGLVRIEWVQARYGQVTPANWAFVQAHEFMNSFFPLRYQVADAQNLIVKSMMEGSYEWLLLIEHDVILPPDAFIRINDYMRKADVPVMSGLYYTRSRPSEPVLYRGRGNSYYGDWKMGDLVWVDGVPTGILLIHESILRTMWEESEEYQVHHFTTRRVFESPLKAWFDPESHQFNTITGTSDLEWCSRIMRDDVFSKAGWTDYADMEFPFLVDTGIFCKHINPNGEQFP